MEGEIPDARHAWIWSLYYAKVLYELGSTSAGLGLKGLLEAWAMATATVRSSTRAPLAAPYPIDPNLKLVGQSSRGWVVFQVDVSNGTDGWPVIVTRRTSKGIEDLAASSVVALGQSLIKIGWEDADYELALCVLGMQQFYAEAPVTDPRSLIEAPRAGIKTAFKADRVIR